MDIKRPRVGAPVPVPQQARPTHTEETPQTAAQPKRRPISKGAKRILWSIVATIVVIIIAGFAYLFIAPRIESAPSFQALLPAGKSIHQLGGWTRVSPPGQAPAFSYNDTIDDVTINVSQQELSSASQSIAEIAKAYNATDKVTASNTTVYIGTSFKGPQSVLFAKGNLLVLIGSESKLSNDSWVAYIDSLK